MQIKPHWFAADAEDFFNTDALNATIFNWTLPGEISVPFGPTIPIPNPLPYKHTRLRFNDTLIHSPAVMINSISNTMLKSDFF